MQIISDAEKDLITSHSVPGGYEWWYFDAYDPTSGYSLVVIFYIGNPFSNRYIRQLKKDPIGDDSLPKHYPAVSISVYKNESPVYYSFTEFEKGDANLSSQNTSLCIEGHSFEQNISSGKLKYEIKLREKLPSGDAIEGTLTFTCPSNSLPQLGDPREEEGHSWNLVQPRAKVEGQVRLFQNEVLQHRVDFNGTGYHDHNIGHEPMKNEFLDWYWGRFHFEDHTLVYYAMNKKDDAQHRALLIDHSYQASLSNFESIDLKDFGLSIFGLKSARKIIIGDEDVEVSVQHSKILDNGPFYQRFSSDAFLNIKGQDVQKSRGISEYIYPRRIYTKLFWPLVDMRIRYKEEAPHWVQESKRLYRWTW